MGSLEILSSKLAAFRTTFYTGFNQAFESTEIWSPKVSITKPGEGEGFVSGVMDRLPRMRKRKGKRVISHPVIMGLEGIFEDYELTVEVDINKVKDDKIAIYGSMIANCGSQTKKLPDDIALGLLQGGKTLKCHDGKPFFAIDHYQNFGKKSGSQANLFTGTTLNYDNFVAKRLAGRKFVGADAKPYAQFGRNLKLVVPPDLEDAGTQVLINDAIARSAAQNGTGNVAAVGNPMKGKAELIVVEDLIDEPNVWYLLDMTTPPLEIIEREPVEFLVRDDPRDPHVWDNKTALYGATARVVGTYGPWFNAIRCEG